MISAIKSFFKNAFNFHGRATRSEYWYVMLASFIVGFIIGVLMVIESAITEREPVLTGILESIFFILSPLEFNCPNYFTIKVFIVKFEYA